MANRSKTKGKGFERQVAKLLADTWGGSWTRTPSSGAFFGGKNAFRIASADGKLTRIMSGDIIVPEEFEGLEVECKSRASFNFMHLLRKEGNKELNAWIDQTWQHTPPMGLLVFKANNTPIFVCHPYIEILPQEMHMLSIYNYKKIKYYIHEASVEWLESIKEALLARLGMKRLKAEIQKNGLSDSDYTDEGNSNDEANLSG